MRMLVKVTVVHDRWMETLLDRAEVIFREECETGAAEERATHAYQNRTGRLEESTRAEVLRAGDAVRADLIMGRMPEVHYATYIVGRGFSSFEDIGERAAVRIEARMMALIG